jgi:cytochrome c peroxidase
MTKPHVVLGLCLALSACRKEAPSSEANAQAGERAAAAASHAAAAHRAKALAENARTLNADTLTLPHELGKMNFPEDNPQSDEKVKLGHQLFFDKRLSADGSRSCYSCHQNEDGNGGKDPTAIGAKDKKLPRHSPVIWNVGYMNTFYWDGRADSLEAQAEAAWAGGNMGVGKDKLEEKAREIAKIPGYKKQFDAAFPGKGVTPQTIVQAISAYERTLICDDTAYDRFAKGDKTALTADQKKGLELFMGKAGCVACHTPPHFSSAFFSKDGTYFNAGVGIEGKKEEEVDIGRKTVTKQDADWAAFKPPSLRNVSKSAPYLHDGSKKDLTEVVAFMASGGFANKNKSPLLTDKKLSADEVKAVVAFLGALDCSGKLEEPKLP